MIPCKKLNYFLPKLNKDNHSQMVCERRTGIDKYVLTAANLVELSLKNIASYKFFRNKMVAWLSGGYSMPNPFLYK